MRSAPLLTSAPADAELMRRIQGDDLDAFEQLYDRYAAKTFQLAGLICDKPDVAEDAVEAGFFAIWKTRADYAPEHDDVETWTMAIVRRSAIEAGNRAGAGDRPPRAPAVPGGGDARLRALLVALPDEQREVITLAFYGKLSHTEIASRLRLAPGTVRDRMRLGLKRLGQGLD